MFINSDCRFVRRMPSIRELGSKSSDVIFCRKQKCFPLTAELILCGWSEWFLASTSASLSSVAVLGSGVGDHVARDALAWMIVLSLAVGSSHFFRLVR